jgi:hypothetical protein
MLASVSERVQGLNSRLHCLGVFEIAAAAYLMFVPVSFRINYHAMRSSRLVGVVFVALQSGGWFWLWQVAWRARLQSRSAFCATCNIMFLGDEVQTKYRQSTDKVQTKYRQSTDKVQTKYRQST